jgi:hypothetical protein
METVAAAETRRIASPLRPSCLVPISAEGFSDRDVSRSKAGVKPHKRLSQHLRELTAGLRPGIKDIHPNLSLLGRGLNFGEGRAVSTHDCSLRLGEK